MRKSNLLSLLFLSLLTSFLYSASFAQSVAFSYSGAVQSYVVPQNVNQIAVDLQGATGGSTGFSRGGNGGRVTCTLIVTPGMILYVNIGGSGGNSTTRGATGGYNGGGTGNEDAGGGGGSSDIRVNGMALSNQVVVAGGGGGACGATSISVKNFDRGGDGGSIVGESGFGNGKNTSTGNFYAGAGGTDGYPRYPNMRNGTYGKGGDGYGHYVGGGGGGGGYFGGSGGDENGGGGGSSYTDASLTSTVVHTRGYNSGGNGTMTIVPVINVLSKSDEVAEGKNANQPFKAHGNLSGSVFCDYAYKAHADTMLEGRSGISQYAKVPDGVSQFQFRRIALGYNYEISQRFSAEFMLAAEDDYNTPLNSAQGDLLSNGKFAPFIKLANLRWKNIVKGSDLVIGQLYTPAFHNTTEEAWAYRSIARTLTDVYRTNEYDMGISIQGHLPSNDNLGYNLMIGNGAGAKPESNSFKWLYGDVYYKFFGKRLIVDFYADYEKLTWTSTWHRDRQMNKLMVAYSVPKYTIGAEAFTNRLMGDDIATRSDGITVDTITTKRIAVSVFIRGRIYKETLGFFARYDQYNWNANSNNNTVFQSHNEQINYYDHNTRQEFVTFGLDYCPYKNVHIMPNVWYNYYENITNMNFGRDNTGFDLVYRLTVSYKIAQ